MPSKGVKNEVKEKRSYSIILWIQAAKNFSLSLPGIKERKNKGSSCSKITSRKNGRATEDGT